MNDPLASPPVSLRTKGDKKLLSLVFEILFGALNLFGCACGTLWLADLVVRCVD